MFFELLTTKVLQKKLYSTPTTRFAHVLKIYDFFKIKAPLKKRCTPDSLKKKIFSTRVNLSVTGVLSLNLSCVVEHFLYNKKPYQLLLQTKSLYNHSIIIPGVELLFPGKPTYNFTKDQHFKKNQYLGSVVFLKDLPYQIYISFLANNYNNKWTFAKSSGTACVRLKAKKSVKLIVVELPSNKLHYYNPQVKCFIGKNTNFFINKFVEGKWGTALHKSKKIVTRGVAMNPVDHPNGGRTKAKQPEKSPWGWIAKRNK